MLVSHLFLIKFYFTRNIASRLSPNSALMLSGLYLTSLKRLAFIIDSGSWLPPVPCLVQDPTTNWDQYAKALDPNMCSIPESMMV